MTSTDIGRRGLMLVLSSPSGAGKTSIARRLLDEEANQESTLDLYRNNCKLLSDGPNKGSIFFLILTQNVIQEC